MIRLGDLRAKLADFDDDHLVFVDHPEADSIGVRNATGGEDLFEIGSSQLPDELSRCPTCGKTSDDGGFGPCVHCEEVSDG